MRAIFLRIHGGVADLLLNPGLTIVLVLALVWINPVGRQVPTLKVLVFSKTAGYRHDAIPDGIALMKQLGATHHFAVDASEDAAVFTDTNLAQYDVVVFLLTTGDILTDSQQAAFERYIQSGRGFVGIHSASDTEHDWPWYGELVGAHFKEHPAIQSAELHVVDRNHPSTVLLPELWKRMDEWYNFASNPRVKVHVLATLDEATYAGGNMGSDHPIAWYQLFDGGRSWYTAGGHTAESYSEPLFQQHILGGLLWATGVAPVYHDHVSFLPVIRGN